MWPRRVSKYFSVALRRRDDDGGDARRSSQFDRNAGHVVDGRTCVFGSARAAGSALAIGGLRSRPALGGRGTRAGLSARSRKHFAVAWAPRGRPARGKVLRVMEAEVVDRSAPTAGSMVLNGKARRRSTAQIPDEAGAAQVLGRREAAARRPQRDQARRVSAAARSAGLQLLLRGSSQPASWRLRVLLSAESGAAPSALRSVRRRRPQARESSGASASASAVAAARCAVGVARRQLGLREIATSACAGLGTRGEIGVRMS